MRAHPHHLGERKFLEHPHFLTADAHTHHHVLRVTIWSVLVTAAVVAAAAWILG
jgi:type VI protein secretion system component VasF